MSKTGTNNQSFHQISKETKNRQLKLRTESRVFEISVVKFYIKKQLPGNQKREEPGDQYPKFPTNSPPQLGFISTNKINVPAPKQPQNIGIQCLLALYARCGTDTGCYSRAIYITKPQINESIEFIY